jgi:CheY-like chemotaxis protein
VGKGTVFALSLPASEGVVGSRAPLAPSMPQPQTPAGSHRRAKVLLVEDDARVRNATRMLLKVEGYEVVVAGSPAEALGAIEANPDIGLLVTDYHLGTDETGVQVIATARQKLGAALPAVLVTGDTSSAMQEIGVDARLRTASKPINPDQLLALLAELAPNASASSR